MNQDLGQLFAEILTATTFHDVQGDILPLPPSALPFRTSLLVNCFCKPDSLNQTPHDLLTWSRSEAGKALRVVSKFVGVLQFDLVGVAIYQLIGPGSNMQIYYANLNRVALDNFDISNYQRAVLREGSHLDRISEILANEGLAG